MASTETDSSEEVTTEAPKLQYDVKVDKLSACERHVVVTISRAEVDRYFKEAFDGVVPKADLPGFRTGKAPRKLIESRFKAEVAEQVKNSLVIESLQDITEGSHFSPLASPSSMSKSSKCLRKATSSTSSTLKCGLTSTRPSGKASS